ncbi:rap/ran GTPase-activating protein [Naegleria gruberi]|uniref:Rap/ran GTPase-activating protein n=1 Tax=Naegleria gruberi TaxID=5762 RepID=D2UXW7_NAEGR|nr:rap/ran GTPase-activating protein [Naegleria gruberi]EFC50362.1 rap/ran GTPase-activating protein [Naegleria gruberi]|eukprot:XP_002683106.1 rap/ran GTPase-activating protein [Naegleria gruberi strain NEG-M]
MLLGWIDELGLIQSDPTKNILKTFPLDVKRVVISSIVDYFNNQNNTAKNGLSTTAHVEWVMEVVGHAFQLPIADHQTIDRAINVYNKWLFEENQRPIPLQENLQYFVQQIFNHFSLLFEERGPESGATGGQEERKHHIHLCNRVLDIFLQMGLKGDMLEEVTWNHILKIILGITDSTLRGKRGLPELSYGLLKVLFELWLCSLSDDKVMWRHLQEHGILWSKNNATINQWNSVCIGLTSRVINLLYGPSEGTSVVRIQWEGLNAKNNPNPNVGNSTTELDLPDEYVYYAWNQFLHIIGNPNKLVDPEIHLKAFQGIEVITHSLAYVGTDPPIKQLKEQKVDFRIPYAPDANSILDIFGPWYFEAVFRENASNFNQGRAVAYSALCKIFCRKGGSPIHTRYLSLFYKALCQGLEDEDPIVVIAILLGSKKIFCYEELVGSHILIRYYTKVCDKILGGTGNSVKDSSQNSKYNIEVRQACITIIGSLICFPNHFSSPNIQKTTSDQEIINQSTVYQELKFQIQTILQKALKSERNPKNLQYVIWAIVVLIYEEIDHNAEIAIVFIRNMLDIVKTYAPKPLKEYPPEVFIAIYEALSSLTNLYPKLAEAEPMISREIVFQLSTIIPMQVALLKQNQTSAKLIEETFYSMADWVMCGPSVIISNKESITKVIFAIDQGLNIVKHVGVPGGVSAGVESPTATVNPRASTTGQAITSSSTSFSKDDIENIKISAEFVVSHLMNHVSHFPITNNNAALTATLSEESQCLDDLEPENSNYVRFYIYDNQFIISLIEQPNEKGGPGVTMIMRDLTGKYSWDSRVLYGEVPKPYSELEERGCYTGSNIENLLGKTQEAETNSTLMQYSIERPLKDRDTVSLFSDLIEEEEDNENLFLQTIDNEYTVLDVSCREPNLRYKYGGDCKASMSRLLLSTMGLVHIALTSRFVPLQSNSKLLRSLRNLDGTQPRETHKVGVVYVKEGQDDQQDLFLNAEGSEQYTSFVKSLGWNVPLQEHLGFMGGLDKNGSTGTNAPYYADYRTELMFHVPTMMPNNSKDPQQIHKKRHVGNDHVNIIWSEHTRDYYRNTIISQFNFVHIVLYPLNRNHKGLLRVDVMVKERTYPVFGPVLDGMILSEKVAGALIRMTALNGSRISRSKSTGIMRPYLQRKSLIAELAQRYKATVETDKYYCSLFVSKETSNVILDPPSQKKNIK